MSNNQIPSEMPVGAIQPTAVASHPVATPTLRRGPSTKQMIIVVVILSVGVLLTALTSDVTRVSEPGIRLVDGKPFLPDKAGLWVGDELQGLTDVERQQLPADTQGGRRLYTDQNGNKVFCAVVLAGRDVTSIHRPELCLPGQGWKIESEHVEPIAAPAAPSGTLKVMRMNMERTLPTTDGGTVRTRHVFVYWFVGKDRLTPIHWQRILWTAEDRVLFSRNHRWAYFLVHAQVVPSALGAVTTSADDQAMNLIRKFVQDVFPSLVPQP